MSEFSLIVITGGNEIGWETSEGGFSDQFSDAFHKVRKEYNFDKNRLFEYTDENLKQKYIHKLSALENQFCVLMYENGYCRNRPTFIGKIKKVTNHINTHRLLFKYITLVKLPFVDSKEFWGNESLLSDLDIASTESTRTHWAVKNANLFSAFKNILPDEDRIKFKNSWESAFNESDTIFPVEKQIHSVPSIDSPASLTNQQVKEQVNKILDDKFYFLYSAQSSAQFLEEVISIYLNNSNNNELPDDWKFLEEMKTSAQDVNNILTKNAENKFAELENIIRELQNKILTLNEALANSTPDNPWNIFVQNFAKSAGNNLASAMKISIIMGMVHISGVNEDSITNIIKSFR